MQEDTSRVMKEPWFLRGIRICGGWGFAPTTTYTVLFSGRGGVLISLLGQRASCVGCAQCWASKDEPATTSSVRLSLLELDALQEVTVKLPVFPIRDVDNHDHE